MPVFATSCASQGVSIIKKSWYVIADRDQLIKLWKNFVFTNLLLFIIRTQQLRILEIAAVNKYLFSLNVRFNRISWQFMMWCLSTTSAAGSTVSSTSSSAVAISAPAPTRRMTCTTVSVDSHIIISLELDTYQSHRCFHLRSDRLLTEVAKGNKLYFPQLHSSPLVRSTDMRSFCML